MASPDESNALPTSASAVRCLRSIVPDAGSAGSDTLVKSRPKRQGDITCCKDVRGPMYRFLIFAVMISLTGSWARAQSLAELERRARNGDPASEFRLALEYAVGANLPRDLGEAIRWYRKAAERGYVHAQYNLGVAYHNGLGVARNDAESVRWYRKAADQGEATAQNNIGVFYDKGYGVAPDYGEAVRWYRMAASQGNIDAEYNLALLYADGRGVPRDLVQARQWMQNAADAGDPEAKKWLSNHGG
jgi:TPR repeat protein